MRALKPWEKNHCNSDDPEVIIREFKKRQKTALILLGVTFICCIALPFFCIYVFGMSKQAYENLGLPIFTLTVPITCFYFIFRYRCPRCNAIPKSTQALTTGILLFPKKCSNCGAPLMINHQWAQD